MEEEKKKKRMEEAKFGFDSLNKDIVDNILRRLPALSLAAAACVCKSWCQHCSRVLSRPKLASAMSLNSSLRIAVQEVLDKVLCEPIRPHFAIVTVFSHDVDDPEISNFLARKLGSRTPLIVTCANGIIGRDALTNQFKEVMGGDEYSDGDGKDHLDANSGILLTVGFVPGLKVEAIPLMIPAKKEFQGSMIDDFIMEIRNYTTSASACTSPVGIMMFGGSSIDLKPVMEKMDYALSKETIIAGDEKTTFMYRSGAESRNFCGKEKYFSDVVALVFARDREKPHGIGEIQFHALLSGGVTAIGPRYKAASVRANFGGSTWLTARREGQQDILDGQSILDDIVDELENRGGADLYIGVTKHRKCFIGKEKSRLISSLAFHVVMGGDEESLNVWGTGIRTGDYFQFYDSDPRTALSSCSDVSAKLRNLKLDCSTKRSRHPTDHANECKKECFGCFIFACCGRSESFFRGPNVNGSPFLENFPEVPLAGIFCDGEIGRGLSISNAYEGQEESCRSCLHVYSTVYLALTYSPAPLEN